MLGAPRSSAVCRLLGYTPPKDYEAGVIEDGNKRIKFDAGTSMRVWVATDDSMGVTTLKVKTEDIRSVWSVLEPLGRGVEVEVEYSVTSGNYRLHGVKALANAGK